MNDCGFIPLRRSFFSHPLWEERRAYSRAEAWLDMIATAAFQETKKLVAGALIEVPRGGIVASERFLSDRWMWSRTKVRAFLDLLRTEEMVTTSGEKTTGCTIVLLCNYEQFNTTKRPSEDHLKTKEEKGNKGIVSLKSRATMVELVAFCEAEGLTKVDAESRFHAWEANGWSINGKPMKCWKSAIRSWKAAGYHPSQKGGVNGRNSPAIKKIQSPADAYKLSEHVQ